MKPAVVITTINEPTNAIFSWLDSFDVFIVPDKKTPTNIYKSMERDNLHLVDMNENCGLSSLPWNHYSRKNIGYIAAMQCGFESIIDTDDDTFFDPSRNFVCQRGSVMSVCSSKDNFVNIFQDRYKSNYPIWPRGYPLEFIASSHVIRSKESKLDYLPSIIQYLINGDTDVDAIHRLTFGPMDISFEDRSSYDVINKGMFCPFNSQLTEFHKDAFVLMYLPNTVTFRFTDILRSIVAKAVLDKIGCDMAFYDSIGYQIRNPHNYMDDFASEIPCYTSVSNVWRWLSDLKCTNYIDLISESYDILANKNIVASSEITSLNQWLQSFINNGG